MVSDRILAMTLNGQTFQDVMFAIALIGGVIVYSRSRIPQQNVKNLTALTDTYEKRIRALEDELKDNHQLQLNNVAAIADLQGQIKVYKELPLQQLANGIDKVAATQDKILSTLQASATALTKDTTAAAIHVAEVKADLEKA